MLELEIKQPFMALPFLWAQHQAMLDKMETVALLAKAMRRKGVKQVDLANECDVSEQAVAQWFKTGRISKPNLARSARLCDISVEELLTGDKPKAIPAPQPAPQTEFSQDESDLVEAYRALPQEQRDAVWTLIDAFVRSTHPEVDRALGPRDPARSRRIEPRLIVADITRRAAIELAAGPSPKSNARARRQ